MICITSAISIARGLVVKSECEMFGHVWCKAILSEYDRNLLDNYGIMAYWGNDVEVQNRINSYLTYSSKNKLDAQIGNSSSQIIGYELGDIDNFKKAIENGWASNLLSSNEKKRIKRDKYSSNDNQYGKRIIANNVVIDTLPSNGLQTGESIKPIVSIIKDGESLNKLLTLSKEIGAEYLVLNICMDNSVTTANKKEGYFRNEWEYIIGGSMDDETNLNRCKTGLFLIRNALNIAYLTTNPEKKALINTVSEVLSPGASGLLTSAIITEIWAAAESKVDVNNLLDNRRVPFVKTKDSWQTDLRKILDDNGIKNRLNEDGLSILEEQRKELENSPGAKAVGSFTDGQNYDEYLLAMMMLINENTRTRRIMDIIQINMKYWYYRDFNMMEYYTGVRFSIKANGRAYDFEDAYK